MKPDDFIGPPLDLVGITEIAARTGVSRQAIPNWRRRYPDFPKPIVQLSCGPIYLWDHIVSWGLTRGTVFQDRRKAPRLVFSPDCSALPSWYGKRSSDRR